MTAAASGRAAARAALVILLVAGAARAGEGAAPAARERGPEPAVTAASAPERSRVAAGVLSRAASRRAQKRGAAAPGEGTAAGAKHGDGRIESIEIDWNGSGSTP